MIICHVYGTVWAPIDGVRGRVSKEAKGSKNILIVLIQIGNNL